MNTFMSSLHYSQPQLLRGGANYRGGPGSDARTLFHLASEPKIYQPQRLLQQRGQPHPIYHQPQRIKTPPLTFKSSIDFSLASAGKANKMSAISNYPLMDTLNSAMFRLSMEDLVRLRLRGRKNSLYFFTIRYTPTLSLWKKEHFWENFLTFLPNS